MYLALKKSPEGEHDKEVKPFGMIGHLEYADKLGDAHAFLSVGYIGDVISNFCGVMQEIDEKEGTTLYLNFSIRIMQAIMGMDPDDPSDYVEPTGDKEADKVNQMKKADEYVEAIENIVNLNSPSDKPN